MRHKGERISSSHGFTYWREICESSMRGWHLLTLVSHANVFFKQFWNNIHWLFKLWAFIHFWYQICFLHQRENNRSHPLIEESHVGGKYPPIWENIFERSQNTKNHESWWDLFWEKEWTTTQRYQIPPKRAIKFSIFLRENLQKSKHQPNKFWPSKSWNSSFL